MSCCVVYQYLDSIIMLKRKASNLSSCCYLACLEKERLALCDLMASMKLAANPIPCFLLLPLCNVPASRVRIPFLA